MYDIPENDPAWDLYRDEDWIKDPNISQDIKNYAAMVSMVDYNVGQVLDLLKELGLEKDTIVFLLEITEARTGSVPRIIPEDFLVQM